MKHTTILQKSSLSVVLQHVLVELSEIHYQDVLMYIRLCVLQVQQILLNQCQKLFRVSYHRRNLFREQLMDIAHMVTRLVWLQVQLKRFIILIMQQREWKSEQLWVQHQDVQYRDLTRIREILLYYQVAVQVVTVVVELQVHQRFIQKNLLKLVVQKFRKVMHLQNVNCSVYLEEKKLATLLRSVMTLVPAVFQLLLVNWQTDYTLTQTRFQRSMQVLTEQKLLFQNHRKEWQLLLIRVTLISF